MLACWEAKHGDPGVNLSDDGRVATTTSCDGGFVLGADVMESGIFTFTVEVVRSRDDDGGGMVVGVASAEADGELYTQREGWGLNLYSGAVLATNKVDSYGSDVQKLLLDMDRGLISKTFNPGATVQVHVNMVQGTLVYSINGGQQLETASPILQGSGGLRPWVLLGQYKDDAVKLVDFSTVMVGIISFEHHETTGVLTCMSVGGDELVSVEVPEPQHQSIVQLLPDINGSPIMSVAWRLISSGGAELTKHDLEKPVLEVHSLHIHSQ